MDTISELQRLREYGQAVLQHTIEAEVREDLAEQLAELRTASEQLVETASRPMKIGVVGEFSSGKTLMLGALAGFGDLLPVSAVPTTGNVTSIRFLQAAEGAIPPQPAAITSFRIEFLDRSGVHDCIRYMGEELHKRAGSALRPQSEMAALQDILQQEKMDLSGLMAWCQEVWGQGRDLALRQLIRELVSFIRCSIACGEALYGRKLECSPETAQEGLTLPTLESDILAQRFEDLPPVAESLPSGVESITASQLRTAFQLVRRCGVDVTVAPEVWDLSTMSGQEGFIVLDFPGLGSMNSGVRDEYLCHRELEEVQTILVVLNGQRPGSGGATPLYTMMKSRHTDLADRVLVAVGRFDQLPLEATQKEALEELVAETSSAGGGDGDGFGDWTSVSLSESLVQQKAPPLKHILGNAQDFTIRDDRIALISQILPLADLAEDHPGMQVGSDRFVQELNSCLPQARDVQAFWKAIADGLRGDTSGTLRKWLFDFCRGGGIGRLRQMIKTHVANHGLAQVLQAAKVHADRVDRSKLRLIAALAETGQHARSHEDAVAPCRDAIRSLLRAYNGLKEQYANNPPELCVSRNGRRVSVSALLKEEMIWQVYARWPEWDSLSSEVRKGHVEITPASGQDDPFAGLMDMLGATGASEGPGAPTSSEDFREAYEGACAELEQTASVYLRDAIHEAVVQLVNHPDIESARAVLGPLLRRSPSDVDAGFKTRLQIAIDPAQVEPKLVEACRLPAPSSSEDSATTGEGAETPAIDWARAFPSPSGRVFAWHPDVRPLCPPQERHQVQYKRLRVNFVDGPNRVIGERVGEVAQSFATGTMKLFDVLSTTLADALNKPGLAESLAGTGGAPAGEGTNTLVARLKGTQSPLL